MRCTEEKIEHAETCMREVSSPGLAMISREGYGSTMLDLTAVTVPLPWSFSDPLKGRMKLSTKTEVCMKDRNDAYRSGGGGKGGQAIGVKGPEKGRGGGLALLPSLSHLHTRYDRTRSSITSLHRDYKCMSVHALSESYPLKSLRTHPT